MPWEIGLAQDENRTVTEPVTRGSIIEFGLQHLGIEFRKSYCILLRPRIESLGIPKPGRFDAITSPNSVSEPMLRILSSRLSRTAILQLLFIVLWSFLLEESHSQDVATEKPFIFAAHYEPFSPSGTLVICGGGSLPDVVRKLFVRAAGGEKAKIVIVPTASWYADKETDEYWIEDWLPFNFESITVLHTRDPKVADSDEFVRQIEAATGIWFSGGDQSRLSEVFLGTRAQKAFENVALRGGVIGGTSAGAAIASQVMIADGRKTPVIKEGLNLLPDAITDQHFSQRGRIKRLQIAVNQHPYRVGLGLDESTAVVVHGRSMRVFGDGNAHVVMAKTENAPALEMKLSPNEPYDWTTLVRQTRERHLAPFPLERSTAEKLKHGALVIVGGGKVKKEIVNRFVELAGGDEARIVVLPTATDRPPSRSREAAMFLNAGAGSVKTLSQIALEEIESDEYLEQLRKATGIWFGGGRQWHFVDHYENTKALNEMRECLIRGGVIGGSSAGASIIGDLLIRGAPVGNQIMVQDGYRRGFGFLPGVGIDQHFTQRNRSNDLSSTIEQFPSIVGIGIDENTALVVTPKTGAVIGDGSVFVFRASADKSNGKENKEPARDPETEVFAAGEMIPIEKITGPMIQARKHP
jgi:cyanophycinase